MSESALEHLITLNAWLLAIAVFVLATLGWLPYSQSAAVSALVAVSLAGLENV